MFKKWPNIMTQYKSITIANGTISQTANHLVYARRNIVDQFNPMLVLLTGILRGIIFKVLNVVLLEL